MSIESITKMMWDSLLLLVVISLGAGEAIRRNATVELPTVKLVDCQEKIFLKEFDKCLIVKFSYMEEYAGLNRVGRSSKVLLGKLYATEGTCNEDSRVSVSIERNLYFVRQTIGFIMIKL